MAKYDLPASLDYITEKTGQKRMHYVGHSQGTVVFWAMTAERPEYNKKIISMNALAPVAFMKHTPNIFIQILDKFLGPFGV